MNATYELDLGKSPVKVSSRDMLLWLMRGIVADCSVGNVQITRQDAVASWRARIADHPDHDLLVEQMEEHYGLLLFQRCTVPVERDPQRSQDLRRRVRETIASQIVLSTWMLPIVGKPLADCTFAEIAEAAPVAGRFLAMLAKEGAPGTLVREVFPNEEALQEFWTQAQR